MLVRIGCFVFLYVIIGLASHVSGLCDSDAFAISGCKGNYCGERCFESGPSRALCPHVCVPGGCRCVPGYKYDTNVKTCVLESLCTVPVDMPSD